MSPARHTAQVTDQQAGACLNSATVPAVDLGTSFPSPAVMTGSAPGADAPSGATVVDVAMEPGETPGQAKARKVMNNHVGSALVLKELVYPTTDIEVEDFCAILRASGDTAAGGDTKELQAMLAGQALALDGIFTNFARRAALEKSTDMVDRMLRIALKAQSQCRTTVESLAVIQQGPAIFAKQANVNNGGQQQVNNGTASSPQSRAPARKNAKGANRTIEARR